VDWSQYLSLIYKNGPLQKNFPFCIWTLTFLPSRVCAIPLLYPLTCPGTGTEIRCGWCTMLLTVLELFADGLLLPSVCNAARRRASKSSSSSSSHFCNYKHKFKVEITNNCRKWFVWLILHMSLDWKNTITIFWKYWHHLYTTVLQSNTVKYHTLYNINTGMKAWLAIHWNILLCAATMENDFHINRCATRRLLRTVFVSCGVLSWSAE
jgi:hypothetical protein